MIENDEIFFPEDIYTKYLAIISGIKFTPREIDVIACVLHGKNTKGIANFLSSEDKPIGEKSIETHILNIRRKIAGCTRESIINFIEQSDKYQIVRNYYSSLLIQKEFKKSLREVSILIKPHAQSFLIVFYSEQETETFAISQLQDHLRLLVENVSIEVRQDFIPISIVPNLEKHFTIYIILKKEEIIFEKIETGDVGGSSILDKDQNSINTIFLLPGEEHVTSIKANLSVYKYIDLACQKNYYFLFFEILSKLFPVLKTDLDKVVVKFKDRYESIQVAPISAYSSSNQDLKNKESNQLISTVLFLKRKGLLVFWLFLVILIFVVGGGLLFSLYEEKKQILKTVDQEVIKSNLLLQDNNIPQKQSSTTSHSSPEPLSDKVTKIKFGDYLIEPVKKLMGGINMLKLAG